MIMIIIFLATQVFVPGQRLNFFSSVPNSARFLPFKMHEDFSNSVTFRLLKYMLLVQDFMSISARFFPFKMLEEISNTA